MGRKGVSVCLVMILLLGSIVVLDVTIDITPRAEAITIYVDDDYGSEDATHKKTIQAGVDNATPGDTVYVYSGIYYEDVYINKTISLIGEERDTTIINSTDLMGIYVTNADFVNISGFTVKNGSWAGIRLMPSNNSLIENNRVEWNNDGIQIIKSNNTIIKNNIISTNTDDGIYIGLLMEITNYVINSTISNSIDNDVVIGQNCHGIFLNTTFDKTNVLYANAISNLENNWYLHINVTDSLGQPIPNVDVCIKDNQNSLPAQKYTTDSKGYIRWLTQTEYIEQDTNGDTVGEKTYYTPHRITAWNETLLGYAEVNINESKEVNIVLDTPYYEIPLSAGWNLISLPLVQSDTSISTVLSSIAGNYDIVQWYNASDGKWHSTNDYLTDINHTMGFWIHMKTADTLIVNGTIPNTTSIQLYQGWNLVGNPSFCNHGIDDILSTIATKYVAVQQYDSWDNGDPWKHYHINKPQNLNDLDYMTSGRGYWLYVKEDCIWEVSNF